MQRRHTSLALLILFAPALAFSADPPKSPERETAEMLAPGAVKKYDALIDKYDETVNRVKGTGSSNTPSGYQPPQRQQLTEAEKKAQADELRRTTEAATSPLAEENYGQQATRLMNQVKTSCYQKQDKYSLGTQDDCESALQRIQTFRSRYKEANAIRKENALQPLPGFDALYVDPVGDYPARPMSADERERTLARNPQWSEWASQAEQAAQRPKPELIANPNQPLAQPAGQPQAQDALAQVAARSGADKQCAQLMQTAYASAQSGASTEAPLEWSSIQRLCQSTMRALSDSLPKRTMDSNTRSLFANSIASSDSGGTYRNAYNASASAYSDTGSSFDWGGFIGLMGQAYINTRQQQALPSRSVPSYSPSPSTSNSGQQPSGSTSAPKTGRCRDDARGGYYAC